MSDEKKNGNGKIPARFLIYIIATVVAVGIAWGTLRENVKTNTKDIIKAETARVEMKAEFVKAIDKLFTTAEKTNELLMKQETQMGKIETELWYIRKNRNSN